MKHDFYELRFNDTFYWAMFDHALIYNRNIREFTDLMRASFMGGEL